MTEGNLKTIFFVDDEPTICREISEILSNARFKVFCYTNPNICLGHLLTKKCDLLIIDYKLPEMDGMTLMKAAKRLLPFLPVIIITGYSNTSLVVSAMREGAEDFLEKPLNTELFLTKIRGILKHSDDSNLVISSLTYMEKKVYSLLMSGKNNKEIARLLCRSRRTIENHRAHLMTKLNAHNSISLVRNISMERIIKLNENAQISDEI